MCTRISFYSRSKGGSVAAKIMSKMGYKMGQGLGKKEQGMSTALQVEKTGKRAGKIIHERDIPKGENSRDAHNSLYFHCPCKYGTTVLKRQPVLTF